MMIQLRAESLVEVYKNRGKINRYSRFLVAHSAPQLLMKSHRHLAVRYLGR